MNNRAFFYLILFTALFLGGCSQNENANKDRVVIGLSSSLEQLNPMYAFNINEGHVISQLFLTPFQSKWNEKDGRLVEKPLLVKSYSYEEDKNQFRLVIKENLYWSDQKPITTDDFIYSLMTYSNPNYRSRFAGSFGKYFRSENGIDSSKTFEKISKKEIVIKFAEKANPTIYDFNFPILPKHILGTNPTEIPSDSLCKVTSGPYKLAEWNKTQFVKIVSDTTSYLHSESQIEEIVFKIIPNANSRINQLKLGEIDFIEFVDPENLKMLDEDNLVTDKVSGREIEFITWNLVGSDKNEKREKHPLFGSRQVRKALSYAINKKEIFEQFLLSMGIPADGPVSPIFKIDSSKVDFDYNIQLAEEILENEGWQDEDGDGVLEKNGERFEFELIMPSGIPRREYAATMIKADLGEIGIQMKITMLESAQFGKRIFSKNFDAAMFGWVIPLPLDLKVYWHSNPRIGRFNFGSYTNEKLDKLLEKLDRNNDEFKSDLKQIQAIIKTDKPAEFLYWVDNIVCYNDKLKNINVSPLGAMNRIWEWNIK